MKRVSVCIPSYNSSKYIGETIQSVLDSAYPNFEIIVSDNASTDGTREIVEGFGDERIHFYQNESNLGVPRNWNQALARASGEFVGLLFSDDLYGPFWLNLAVHVLEKYTDVGWVITAYRVIDQMEQDCGAVSYFEGSGVRDWAQAFAWLASFNGWSPVYIARRTILEEIGYYDEDFGLAADTGLLIRLASKCPPYYSSNPHHATYRMHTDSLSHSIQNSVWVFPEEFRILDKVFGDDGLPEELAQHKRWCYASLYDAVLTRSQELLQKGDWDAVRCLIQVMATYGYKG